MDFNKRNVRVYNFTIYSAVVILYYRGDVGDLIARFAGRDSRELFVTYL